MARVQVVHNTNPDLRVELSIELTETDDVIEPSWDGRCTGCAWPPGEGWTRFNSLEGAVQASIAHLDHHH